MCSGNADEGREGDGIPSRTLDRDDLERLIDEGKLAVKNPGI